MNSFGHKLGLLCVVLALFATAGCGKKKAKDNGKASTKTDSKKMANVTIPTLEEETENFLDEDAVSDLAFVDDANGAEKKLAAGDDIPTELAEQEATTAEYAFKTVRFGFNENSIRADQQEVVTADCELAQNAVEAGKEIVVQGHTCQLGSASYNLALSQRRAESVKAEMVEAGIPAENIKTVGYGYEMPLVWSEKKDRASLVKELAPNRRAEVLVN